jgi:hypothetical protein
MNKTQWYVCSFIFIALAIALVSVGIYVSEPGSIMWAVGRIYALAIWVSFAMAAICGVCGYFEKAK